MPGTGYGTGYGTWYGPWRGARYGVRYGVRSLVRSLVRCLVRGTVRGAVLGTVPGAVPGTGYGTGYATWNGPWRGTWYGYGAVVRYLVRCVVRLITMWVATLAPCFRIYMLHVYDTFAHMPYNMVRSTTHLPGIITCRSVYVFMHHCAIIVSLSQVRRGCSDTVASDLLRLWDLSVYSVRFATIMCFTRRWVLCL